MKKFRTLKATVAVIQTENIDTDQLIPADFLKITTKDGLGKHLFSNWRYLPNGDKNPDFVLNKEETKHAQILVAGDNLGCGSSREHAPWALLDYGFRVVISTSIADIFRNNSVKNGLLPIVVDHSFYNELIAYNGNEITIDLPRQTIKTDLTEYTFYIEPFVKYCLINGISQLDFLLNKEEEIRTYELEHSK